MLTLLYDKFSGGIIIKKVFSLLIILCLITIKSSAFLGLYYKIKDFDFGNGIYAAIDEHGNLLHSYDLSDWKYTVIQPNKDYSSSLYKLKWVKSNFFVFGNGGKILISNNGIQWYKKDLNTIHIEDIIWNNGKYIAVGFETIATSTDGMSWTRHNAKEMDLIQSIIHDNEKYILTGGKSSRGKISTSYDGITWSYWYNLLDTKTDDAFGKIIFDGKGYLFKSTMGKLFYSFTLKDIKETYVDYSYNSSSISSITWNGNKYVGVLSSSPMFITSL